MNNAVFTAANVIAITGAVVLSVTAYTFATRHWTGYVYLRGYTPQHLHVMGPYHFLRSCREAALATIQRANVAQWFYECGLNCEYGVCDKVAQ